MRWIDAFLARVRALVGRARHDAQLDRDLQFHVDQQTDELVRAGMPEGDARRQAAAMFGSREAVKDAYRDLRTVPLVEPLWRDARYAMRGLGKARGMTATAIVTLALCLGANLAIFALVDAILLRPLPFPHPDRLVTMFNTYPKAGVMRDMSSITNYYERRGRIAAFTSLSMYGEATAVVGEQGSNAREPILRVSPEFFATLGVGPARGRAFTDDEMTSRADNVVIVTDGYWRTALNGDANVLGRQVRVDGVPRTIVGVLPPAFHFLSSKARLYLPLSSSLDRRAPSQRHAGDAGDIIARLAPGITVADAQAQVDAHNAAVTAAAPSPVDHVVIEAGFRTIVVPLRADYVAGVRSVLLLIEAGALLLFVIGAVNLVNLLIVRASGRVREFATRAALGASRRDLVRQVTVETLVLALAGALLALPIGAGGVRLLEWLGADRFPLGAFASFDRAIAWIGVAAACLAGAAMAIPVIAFVLRTRVGDALRDESRGGTASRAAERLRRVFIVAEVALSFVLVSSAWLLGASLTHALAVPLGFRADHVLTGRISLPGPTYPTAATGLAFVDRLTAAIENHGATAAGVTTKLPLEGDVKTAVTPVGYVPKPGESPRGHYVYGVGGEYFGAMQIPLREGRLLTADDSHRAARVCVVDEDFADRYWPDGHAVGHSLVIGSAGAASGANALRVVGVVGAVKQRGATDNDDQGAVYVPFGYFGDSTFYVVVRTSVPPASFAPALGGIVRNLDVDLPVSDLESMDDRAADSLIAERSPAELAAMFAAVALMLCAVGTYGVVSDAVGRRRREIGVRMALGATPLEIRRQFIALGLRLTAIGTALGAVGACVADVAIRSVLFGVSAVDPRAFMAAAAVVAIATLAACLAPAIRAARIPPARVLNDG